MFDEDAIIKELSFKTVRSSGAGGQHVNKVASKVQLTFSVPESMVLSPEQKDLINTNLKLRISRDGLLVLQCGESRSQHKNKDIVIKRFLDLLKNSLIPEKERKQTQVPQSSKRKRLEQKKKQADKKAQRKPSKLQ